MTNIKWCNPKILLNRNEAVNSETVRLFINNLLITNLIGMYDFNSWIRIFFDRLDISSIVQFLVVMSTDNYLQNRKLNIFCYEIHSILIGLVSKNNCRLIKIRLNKVQVDNMFTKEDVSLLMDWSYHIDSSRVV